MPDDQAKMAPARTTVRHAAEATYDPGLRPFSTYRDLGIRQATGGGYGAHLVRAVPGTHAEPAWHTHALDFQMVFVLKGWVKFEYEDIGEVVLHPGDSVYQPPGIRHREIEHSDGMELLEIASPAEFSTALVNAPRA